MNGPATEEGTKAFNVAKEVRVRKGLKETPPQLDDCKEKKEKWEKEEVLTCCSKQIWVKIVARRCCVVI
jgi:hypothetical protein